MSWHSSNVLTRPALHQLLSINLFEYIKACNFQVGRGAQQAAQQPVRALPLRVAAVPPCPALTTPVPLHACLAQGSSLAVVRRVAQQVLVTLRFLLR